MKRKSGMVFTVIGLLLLAAAFSITGYNIWEGNRADRAAQQAVTQLQQELALTDAAAAQAAAAVWEEEPEFILRDMPAVEKDGYRYIGVLDVPDLELSLPVMEEWDYARLQKSPCRYAGSVYTDNMVLLAHNYPKHFRPIRNMPLGSEIRFTDMDGIVYRYQIVDIETLDPYNIEDMVTGDWDLTLFTCTDSGQTRCTIRCERTDKT